MKAKFYIPMFFLLCTSKYAKAQDSIQKLTNLIAVQQAQIQNLMKFAPGKSCREIKDKYPEALNGQYPLLLSASLPPTMAYCDMKNGGWTRIAAFDGTQNVNINTYMDGRGTLGDPNYAMPCPSLNSITQHDDVTMRVNMGEVRDYFKPLAKIPFCQMLTKSPSTNFSWSSSPDGTFVQPSHYFSHLGGSTVNWVQAINPNDKRSYLSFWGDIPSGNLGGCCHMTKNDIGNWGRPFEVYVR